MLLDTDDFNLVRNVLDALPLHNAFQSGETDLQAGVNGALDLARSWAPDSAMLVVVSDGDSNAGLTGVRPVPPSIAQTVVVGVGDIGRTSVIGDRRTRQDAASLRQLASRLGGEYIDCNQTILPPRHTRRLLMRAPKPPIDRLERNIGLACIGAGSFAAALVGPVLLRYGRRTSPGVRFAAVPHGAIS